MGGFELEVLESYEVALPQNFMAWMMVVGNEDRQDRLPAAVGVVCASDANDAETRVVSPQEQQQINNVVQQFSTTTSIDQVINIINNATTPGTPTITATVNPAIYNNVPCPSPLDFYGTITDNVGNRVVRYQFVFSTGAFSPVQEILFDQPGSRSVSWRLAGIAPPSLEGWVAIAIVEFERGPIFQSNPADMKITCAAPGTGGVPPGGTGSSNPISATLCKSCHSSGALPLYYIIYWYNY